MKKSTKAVLITGATKRLGLCFAKQSLEMGYAIVAHYRSSRGALAGWIRANPSFRDRIHYLRMELTEHPEELVVRARQLPVTLVGLVNNASVFSEGDFRDYAHFERTLMTNAMVPLRLATEFARKARNGWIINITDARSAPMSRTHQNYRISKQLLEELTRRLAFTFAPNIRANAIAPGAVLPPPGKSKHHLLALRPHIPLKRTTALSSLRRAFAYLIENPDVTGQVLYVDGGWHLSG